MYGFWCLGVDLFYTTFIFIFTTFIFKPISRIPAKSTGGDVGIAMLSLTSTTHSHHLLLVSDSFESLLFACQIRCSSVFSSL